MATGFHEDVCCRQHKNKSHTCKPKLGLSMKASAARGGERNYACSMLSWAALASVEPRGVRMRKEAACRPEQQNRQARATRCGVCVVSQWAGIISRTVRRNSYST